VSIAFEHAVEQLRQIILDGTLAPGARLNEAELAATLCTSRTPVREALRALNSQGLVELLPNKGARVTTWSAEDLLEIYDLRAMLESHAAFRAARLARPDDIARLTELCQQMESLIQGGRLVDPVRLSDLNEKFHAHILSTANSPRLGKLITEVVQVPLVVRTFARYSGGDLQRSMVQHRELVAALGTHSGDWASSVMKAHILAARSALLVQNEDSTNGNDAHD